jgi:hypothetical protein
VVVVENSDTEIYKFIYLDIWSGESREKYWIMGWPL